MLMAVRDSSINIVNEQVKLIDFYQHIPSTIKEELQHQIIVNINQIEESHNSKNDNTSWLFFCVDGYDKDTAHKIQKHVHNVDLTRTNIVIINNQPLQKEMLDYLSLKVNGIVSLSFFMAHQTIILRSILEKGIFLEPQFHKTLILEIERKNAKDKPIKKLLLNREKVSMLLSKKEQDILQLILEGKSNKNIAEILFFAPSTIGTIISCLLKKINANDRTDAMVKAIRNGWVDAIR